MQFTVTNLRQTIGQQLRVIVTCASPQALATVTTTLDGAPIGSDGLPATTTQYDRTFDGQPARIGASHTVVVTAIDQSGNSESATKIWTDAT